MLGIRYIRSFRVMPCNKFFVSYISLVCFKIFPFQSQITMSVLFAHQNMQMFSLYVHKLKENKEKHLFEFYEPKHPTEQLTRPSLNLIIFSFCIPTGKACRRD